MAAVASLAATAIPAAWASFTTTAAVVAGSISSATLTAATGLVATCVPATDDVVLVWTASLSLATTGYDVLRASSAGGPFSVIASTSGILGITYTDTLSGGTIAYYEVEPTRDDWIGPPSNELKVQSEGLGLCVIS